MIAAIALFFLISASFSLAIWIVLFGFRGGFWRNTCCLEDRWASCVEEGGAEIAKLERYPSVCAVVPARNEAEVLPESLRSLLQQDYPGSFSIVLADDRSTDGTATVARDAAEALHQEARLSVLDVPPLPAGWTGKLWALENGTRHAIAERDPDYLFLTDADIASDRDVLQRLVAKAETEGRALVSLMVLLRCQSFWEKMLIPAFIFFFAKLYPFPWVNDRDRSTAAAAGGCILLRRDALEAIGGIAAIRDALIDDCALARAIKNGVAPRPNPAPTGRGASTRRSIWLGLTAKAYSLRPYDTLDSIWNMVARTAYTQLHYSPLLLLGTLLGMVLVYLVPPAAVVAGAIARSQAIASLGAIAWLLMTVAYLPIVRFYGLSGLRSLSLPFVASLYTLMTLDSARRHWQGKGGAWKGRTYPSRQERS